MTPRFRQSALQSHLMGDPRAGTAWSLAVDKVTAEVATSLHARGIECVLRRGPVFVEWLYSDRGHRPYMDADLLVSEDSAPAARDVLATLGFERRHSLEIPDPDVPRPRDHAWDRGSMAVDLDTTIFGVEAEPAAVWREIRTGAVRFRVGSAELLAPGEAARCLDIALHAARHGKGDGHTLEDLRRALRIALPQAWEEAARIATRLEAEAPFVTGLRLLPEGEVLCDKLGLAPRVPVDVALIAAGDPPLAAGLERLARTRGTRARVRLIGRELFPRPAFMRWWTPLASRGRAGLVAAYTWRVAWIAAHAPGSLVAWRRAHRQGKRPRLHPDTLRAAVWAVRAVRWARPDVNSAPTDPPRLPRVPAVGRGAERGVTAVLVRIRPGCLVEASVRQAWAASHGDLRSLIIGVRGGAAEFEAHAWLEGDSPGDHLGFVELSRRPAGK